MSTKIQWVVNADGSLGETWNPLAGCSIVSPGCHNCYAMRMARRLEAMGQKKYAGTTKVVDGAARWTGTVNFDEKALTLPIRTKKPTTWFVNSMSDLFHENVPDDQIDQVFAVMSMCPQHTFQVLTKRADRMATYWTDGIRNGRGEHTSMYVTRHVSLLGKFFGWDFMQLDEVSWLSEIPDNVWMGVSVEDQKRTERIPLLCMVRAKVRFVSAEPLLGPINFEFGRSEGLPTNTEPCRERADLIHQVIIGGESGPRARSCELSWIRSIVQQCKEADVCAFVKQLGANYMRRDGVHIWPADGKGGKMEDWPAELRVREMPALTGRS